MTSATPTAVADPAGDAVTDGGGRALLTARRRSWLRVNGLMAVAAVWFGAGIWRHRWLHEDGLINVRIVENLLGGHGPVFNVGERVEAYTSPAQIAIMAFLRAVTFGHAGVDGVVYAVGLVASVGGLVAAMRAVVHLRELDIGTKWVVPLGALVFAAVPLNWDFATSGHEGAIGFLWVGLTFWGFAAQVRLRRMGLDQGANRPRWLLVVAGAGVLVRPELALSTLGYLIWWLHLHRDEGRSRFRCLLWAFALPVAYQVFRMGYFGTLVPNTAIAKLGSTAPLSDGVVYLWDFARPFWLLVPLAVVAFFFVDQFVDLDHPARGLVLAVLVPAVLQFGYLVAIRGDYVNGRLVVVPLFALLAPVAVVPWPRGGRLRWRPVAQVAGVLVVCGWAIVATGWLRPPWRSGIKDFLDPRYDEREQYVRQTVGRDPLTLARYRSSYLSDSTRDLARARALGMPDVLDLVDFYDPALIPLPAGQGLWVANSAIGANGVLNGSNVRIIDRIGLADFLASHFAVRKDAAAGHLRYLPTPWVLARAGVGLTPEARAARQAMACGELSDLVDGATAPLTVGRFFSNIFHSPSNTTLTIPEDAFVARQKFCAIPAPPVPKAQAPATTLPPIRSPFCREVDRVEQRLGSSTQVDVQFVEALLGEAELRRMVALAPPGLKDDLNLLAARKVALGAALQSGPAKTLASRLGPEDLALLVRLGPELAETCAR